MKCEYRVLRIIHRSPLDLIFGEDDDHDYVITEVCEDGSNHIDCIPFGSSVESLRQDLNRMLEALDKPVLTDFKDHKINLEGI